MSLTSEGRSKSAPTGAKEWEGIVRSGIDTSEGYSVVDGGMTGMSQTEFDEIVEVEKYSPLSGWKKSPLPVIPCKEYWNWVTNWFVAGDWSYNILRTTRSRRWMRIRRTIVQKDTPQVQQSLLRTTLCNVDEEFFTHQGVRIPRPNPEELFGKENAQFCVEMTTTYKKKLFSGQDAVDFHISSITDTPSEEPAEREIQRMESVAFLETLRKQGFIASPIDKYREIVDDATAMYLIQHHNISATEVLFFLFFFFFICILIG